MICRAADDPAETEKPHVCLLTGVRFLYADDREKAAGLLSGGCLFGTAQRDDNDDRRQHQHTADIGAGADDVVQQ